MQNNVIPLVKIKKIYKKKNQNKIKLIIKIKRFLILTLGIILSAIISFVVIFNKKNKKSINNNLNEYKIGTKEISNDTDKGINKYIIYNGTKIKTEKDFLEISKGKNEKEIAEIYYL